MTAEERAAAAARVLEGTAAVAEVAGSLGVHPSTVRRWVREAATARTPGVSSAPDPALSLSGPPETEPELGQSETARPPPQPQPVKSEPERAPRPPQPQPARPGPERARRTPQPEPSGPEPVADLPGPVADLPGPADDLAQAVPPTVDPDRIMPLVGRLRSAHRYVIVVLAWILMLGVSAVLPRAGELLGVLQFGHLLGLVLAVGAVAVIDWHGLLWMAHRRELRETARIAAAVSPMIWAGLVLLGITGAALKPDLGAFVPWVKMVAVLVVAINGVAASETRQVLRRVAEGATFDAMPRLLAMRMVGSAIISQLAWITTVVIGVATHLARS